jgi:hypothetical protein
VDVSAVSRIRLSATSLILLAMTQGCSDSNGDPATNDSGAPPSMDAAADRPTAIDANDPSDAAIDIPTDGTTADNTTGPTLMQQVAAIVVSSCATSGCHDPITQEHGMDLSTAASIYSSWVNQRGPDHCQNKALVRVAPGNPNGSYVMTKITATMKACDLWDPMPPPPRSPLTTAQIETIRAWIQSGARLEGSTANSSSNSE